jgi:uncharacterized protein (TIGR03435 family)
MNILLAVALAFDVATVKVSPPAAFAAPIGINLGTFRNGTLTMSNVTLAECLQFAYAVPSQDLIAGPDWIKSRETRFDIVAKAAPDTDVATAREMLRSLLAERLMVAIRIEPKPFTFAALVPSKTGNKLKEAQPGSTNSAQPGRIVAKSMPMSGLASLLSRFEQQLFVDETGLSGRYEFMLEWGADAGPNSPGRDGPSLASALEDQLGLRMEKRREPLDVVVVERAERAPTEN